MLTEYLEDGVYDRGYRYYMVKPGGKIIGTNNVLEWADWRENQYNDEGTDFKMFMDGGSRVAKTELDINTVVSTVFLGLDHNYTGGPAILFETMVNYNNGDWDDQTRYYTYQEALAGHTEAVKLAQQRIDAVFPIAEEEKE